MKPSFLDKLKIAPDCSPLYVEIKKDKNPIFIWGCGNVAESVYHYCRQFGIEVSGCFVNVGGTRKAFEGMDVQTLEEVVHRHPAFSVIIGHSQYADGISFLKKIPNISNIFCVTSCIYDKWAPISVDFLKLNSAALNQIDNEAQDEMSRLCLRSYFESCVNDRAECIFPCLGEKMDYYRNDVISLSENEVLLDIGAWEGAAIWPFVEAVHGKYRHIVALEPDERNFQVLKKNIEARGLPDITPKMVCAYDKNEFVKFEDDDTDGQMGGINENAAHYRFVPAMTIDSLCEELNLSEDASLLKINFVFSVQEVLKGAAGLLKAGKPKIIVRVGFDETVLLKACTTVKELNPDYKLYFRYTAEMPQGLTLFAV